MQKQKNCLIVGAGDYIGAAIAKRFAAGGFTVCLARRRGDKNAGLVAEIEAEGGKAHSYSLDAREEDQVINGITTIESEVGALDIVIFNVGGNVNFPLIETTERVFRKVWMMACLGGFLTGREAAKHMLARGHGSIFSPVRQPAFAVAKDTLHFHQQNLAFARSPKAWPVNWALRVFTLRISSLMRV